MSSNTTLKEFDEKFRHSELVCIGLVMKKMQISRPTATNLISTLLNRNAEKRKKPYKIKIEPHYVSSDSRKWYKVIKTQKEKSPLTKLL